MRDFEKGVGMVELEANGIRIWLGGMLTPAPMGAVQPSTSSTVTIAIQPAGSHHQAGLHYRCNGGQIQDLPGTWMWTDPQRKTQYFRVNLPPMNPGDRLEYGPYCRGPMGMVAGGGPSMGVKCTVGDGSESATMPRLAANSAGRAATVASLPPDSLRGFNMVFAVTQGAIFNAIIDNDAYADRWDFETKTSKGKLNTALHASIGPPRIQIFNDSRGKSRIRARFPFESGTFGYWVPDPEDPSQNKFTEFPMAGWSLVLMPELFISQIPWNKLTPEVRQQLVNFNESMFAVKQIALNLQNVNLFDDDWSVDVTQTTGIDPSQPAFIRNFRDTLAGVFEAKKGSDNPYVFGHIVNQESASPAGRVVIDAGNATFNPTGVTYSLYADPQAGTPQQLDRNSLNYLLMVNGQKPSSDPDRGKFPRNWVTWAGSAGSFAVDNALFMREVLKPAAQALAPGYQYNHVNGLNWLLSRYGIDLGDESLPWYVSLKGKVKTRADLVSTAYVVPGTSQMIISNDITYKLKLSMGIDGIAKRTVHYKDVRNYSFDFGVNDRGELRLPAPGVQVITGMKKTKDDKNWAYQLGNFNLGSFFSEWLIEKELGKSLNNALGFDVGELNSLRLFLVMPAGRILIYSRARFIEGGHFYLDVQYDSEHGASV